MSELFTILAPIVAMYTVAGFIAALIIGPIYTHFHKEKA
jgi:hypothetical protein